VERRSAYCNEYKVPSESTEDYKILNIKDLDRVKDAPFLSANDEVVLHPKFAYFLHERFPELSSYEINQKDKIGQKKQELLKVIEIYKQKNPQKYEQKKRNWKIKLNLWNYND
jgi:hypothetical protein